MDKSADKSATNSSDEIVHDPDGGIDRLVEIMARLRDPVAGCPWDVDQTFRTIAPYTIEEAYEVADAIEREAWDELKGELGDPHGNLTYRMAARNFNPIMATAATTTIAQVTRVVDLGGIDPEHVITPGIFVQHIVEVANPAQEEDLNRAEAVYP